MTKKSAIYSRSLGREIQFGEPLTFSELQSVLFDQTMALAKLPEKRLQASLTDQRKRGADAANEARKQKAEERKRAAIWRFRALQAGDRDADDAIALMIEEGFSRTTLYRYLADELKRLGRGRVKQKRTLKSANDQ